MQTISIAVSAILIAAGLITAPSLINNARDVNVKQDLSNVSMAQEYQLSDTGSYVSDVSAITSNSLVKVTLSSSIKPGIITGPDCYGAFSKSDSGSYFYRTSARPSIPKVPTPWPITKPAGYPANCTWPVTAASVMPINNIALNPNALTTVWSLNSNNSAIWSATKGVTVTGNPAGITTAASSRVAAGAATTAIMSMYSIDGLGAVGSPERQFGAWVYVSGSGYEARFGAWNTPDPWIPIPAATWVWVTSTNSNPADSWSQIQIVKTDRSAASEADISYVTGIIASVGPTPIG